MPREKTVDNAILAWLNSLDGCEARKLHGSEYAKKGDPDLYGCYRGHMFQIENKRPGEEPEPIQLARLRQWARAGAKVGVAHSLAEAKEILEPWMRAIDLECSHSLGSSQPSGVRTGPSSATDS